MTKIHKIYDIIYLILAKSHIAGLHHYVKHHCERIFSESVKKKITFYKKNVF